MMILNLCIRYDEFEKVEIVAVTILEWNVLVFGETSQEVDLYIHLGVQNMSFDFLFEEIETL